MTEPPRITSLHNVGVTIGYVLFGIAFCLVPGTGITWSPSSGTGVVLVGILAIIALGAIHLFRSQAPTRAACAGVMVLLVEAVISGTTSIGALLIECDILYSLVIARTSVKYQRLISIIAAACVSTAALGLLQAHTLTPPAPQLILLLLGLGITVWWALTVRAPMTQADAERERAALIAEAAAANQRKAVVAERLQISRELHDTISGQLSAITMQAAGAVAAAPSSLTAEELTERLQRIRTLSLEAMGEMRRLIDVLRTDTPSPVAHPQNWSHVDSLLERARDGGRRITVTGDAPATLHLDPLVSVTAVNVLREALVNAEKHARDSEVTIDIRRLDGAFTMTVMNERNPDPHATSVSSGYGLIGLAERVRLSGGSLDIDATEDTWTLRTRLPLLAGRESQHA